MAHFYLIGGHGDGDPGAVGNGYKEADLARKFNDALAKELRALGQTVTVYNKNRDMYKQTRNGKGLYVFGVNGRIVLETHLNAAANKSANGAETLIRGKADKYDTAIQNTLKKHFVNRGIKQRTDLLNMNVAYQRGINYRLLELCFISNKNDVTYLVKNMAKIAKEMAQALTGKTSGGGGTTPPKPKPPTKKVKRAYIKKGYSINVRLGKPSTSAKIYDTKTYPMSAGLKLTTGKLITNERYDWLEYINKNGQKCYVTVNERDKRGNKYWTIKEESK